MKIEVKFVCPEVVGAMRSGVYEIGEGKTIHDLLAVCERENGIVVDPAHYQWMSLMKNGVAATLDTPLDGAKSVYFLKVVHGG